MRFLLPALLLLTAGCSQPAPEPGIITVAIPVSPNNLDPRYGTDENSARAQELIFNDLVRWDDQTRLAPGLAVSWDTTDHQTYRIRLREGVRFHDGHELTSADVVFTFTSMLDPAFASPWRGALRDLASVVPIDRYTVDFVLKQPSGSFLPNLVFKIVPAGAGRELRDRPVGTGPYEFVSYAVDDRLEMRAFREYFDGLPRNRGIVMKIVPDDIMRGLELRKATSDLVVNDLPPDMVYQLEHDGLALTRVSWRRLPIHRLQPARSHLEGRSRAAGDRLRDRSTGHRRSPAPRSRNGGRQHAAAHQLGARPCCRRLRLRP